MVSVTIRYDLRSPDWAATAHPQQYATCLEQCAWADGRGFDAVILSEHHGIADGYLPSPFIMAAAIAGRTERVPIMVGAALVPLHDPIRLAEQIAVLDLASGGRTSFVAGLGYRRAEFDMAGVDRSRRGLIYTEYIETMRRAWTGEPFEWQGRTVLVTPRPMTQPHPPIFGDGATVASARRSARLGLGYFPGSADPELMRAYHDECAKVGFAHGFVRSPKGPGALCIAEDPDATWAQIAKYAWHDSVTYRSWADDDAVETMSQVYSAAADLDALRDAGTHVVVTPNECLELAEELGPDGVLTLHPLLCGVPVEIGWRSLELMVDRVLPHLQRE